MLWIGIGILVLLAVASATPKDHAEADNWVKRNERYFAIAAAILWALLILGAIFPAKTP